MSSNSRRNFMKWITAAGTAAILPKGARAHGQFDGYPGSYGVLHDTTLCIGCRSCEAACNEVNDFPQPEKPFEDKSVLDKRRRVDDKCYTVV